MAPRGERRNRPAKRDNKVLTSWTDAELERLRDAAETRGEPLAVLVRNLTLAALSAVESVEKR